MSCTLANPNSDLALRLNQYNSLSLVSGDKTKYKTDNSETSIDGIPVELASLDQLLKSLPMSFNVTCPVSSVPTLATPQTLKYIKALCEPAQEDLIAQALYNTYIGLKTDIIGLTVDLGSKDIVNQQYISKARELLLPSGQILICVQNYNNSHKAKLDELLKLPNSKACVYCSPLHILTLLRYCNSQILTGSLLGWWAAAECSSVACPVPWTPGLEHQFNKDWKLLGCGWAHTRFFDRVYYINLDRRADRRAHMESQLMRRSLVGARVAAIDGAGIKWEPKFGINSKFWNSGAFAYCLSYRCAIIDAMKNGHENILVMDDDAVLSDNLFQVLDKAFNDLPKQWHMLYLGANHGVPTPVAMPTEADRVGDYLYKLKGSMGSHAIIINKVVFPTLLNFLASPYAPLDLYFSLYQKFFPCYITYPGLAHQLGGHSDIIDEDIDYSKDWKIDYINHIDSRKPLLV